MIDKPFLTAQAIRWQTGQRNVIREYCQHAFLSALYKQRRADHLFFKGGTALRILFESPRFSEDLDFSSRIHSVSTLETIVQEVLVHLAHEGIPLDISEAKPTTGGYLFTADVTLFGTAFSIKLNVVMKPHCSGETHMVNSIFLPPYAVTALARKDITREKVRAFLTRTKPRDIFDLYFLLRSSWAHHSVVSYTRDIKRVLETKDLTLPQLQEFLPQSFWPVIKHIKNNIAVELDK
ncbi:nucleotidyl transferase AbiEii/AbiGii toxin family protein [Candidatus Gottesmanbacteria bacterium]|nr:nucleotidyl transferase AbiEii/AbiGii toxin family protein [Candidatus Gottesmanbacteria bacterium]